MALGVVSGLGDLKNGLTLLCASVFICELGPQRARERVSDPCPLGILSGSGKGGLSPGQRPSLGLLLALLCAPQKCSLLSFTFYPTPSPPPTHILSLKKRRPLQLKPSSRVETGLLAPPRWALGHCSLSGGRAVRAGAASPGCPHSGGPGLSFCPSFMEGGVQSFSRVSYSAPHPEQLIPQDWGSTSYCCVVGLGGTGAGKLQEWRELGALGKEPRLP